MKRILLLFIDGLGIAPPGEHNPITEEAYPALCRLIRQAIPIDAALGVPGIPQSATGQASMLTGVNAAERCGRHIEGFPGPLLQEIITESNLLLRLHRSGYKVTFANAYTMKSFNEVQGYRHRSVTTTCVLSCPSALRLFDQLQNGEAVYQDITRKILTERGIDIEEITPEEAAQHLSGIVADHDLTLFEYFQSDRAGHGGSSATVAGVLSNLERFCEALFESLRGIHATILLTSDHGNIEDLSVRTHTHNAVPCYTEGPLAGELRTIRSLIDITPAIIRACASKPETQHCP